MVIGEVRYSLAILATLIYFFAAADTSRRYGNEIAKSNKILMVSWTVEGAIRITKAIVYISAGDNTLFQFTDGLSYLITIANILFFCLMMFKLKWVLIYMDDDMQSEKQLLAEVKRLNFARIVFGCCVFVSSVDRLMIIFGKQNIEKMTEELAISRLVFVMLA